MSKILCIPVVNDDGWNSAIASSLASGGLWALLDDADEPTFVENPLAESGAMDVDRASASLWMFGADAVIARGADEAFVETLTRRGVVVLGADAAVTIGQVRRAWNEANQPVEEPEESAEQA